MGKTYSNITDLINDLDADKRFKEKTIKYIENHSFSKYLSYLRCASNLTQEQLAKKIKCSQSRISKIESSPNDKTTIKDLADYGMALNKRMLIRYEDNDIKIVNLIKHHAFQIKHLLDKLASFPKGDKKMDEEISKFFAEAYFNIQIFFETSSRKLNNIKISTFQKEPIKILETKEFEKLEEDKIKQKT